MNQPPLNPDALEAAADVIAAFWDVESRPTDAARAAVSAYLAVAQPEVNSVERHLCVCGKQVTLKKDGTFRSHDGNMPLGPGSRFKARCEGSGENP